MLRSSGSTYRCLTATLGGMLALCVPTCSGAQGISLTVHSDGSGNFTSVQAALDSCAPGAHPDLGRVTLLLRGLFFESVEVYSNFSAGVTFIGTGEGPLDALIINNRPGTLYSWLSATVKVDSADFFAHNVAFANNASNYNHTAAGQSLALYLGADRAALDGCALLGGQDTLCAWQRRRGVHLRCRRDGAPVLPSPSPSPADTGTGRVWLRGSFVNGSVDSIYGEGSAVLDACNVTITDHVTAQRGNGSTAYLFRNCSVAPAGASRGYGGMSLCNPSPSLSAAMSVRAGGAQTDLGRPWGPNASVVYKASRGRGGEVGRAGGECASHPCLHRCLPAELLAGSGHHTTGVRRGVRGSKADEAVWRSSHRCHTRLPTAPVLPHTAGSTGTTAARTALRTGARA